MDESLRPLLDRQEIVDVCVRYTTALDTKDWPLLETCFVPSVEYIYPGGRSEGVKPIQERCTTALTSLTASQHMLGNFTVEVDGDEADSSCYFQAQHVLTGTPGGDFYTIAGIYRDHMVRTTEGWRIARREQSYLWKQGNRRVVGKSD